MQIFLKFFFTHLGRVWKEIPKHAPKQRPLIGQDKSLFAFPKTALPSQGRTNRFLPSLRFCLPKNSAPVTGQNKSLLAFPLLLPAQTHLAVSDGRPFSLGSHLGAQPPPIRSLIRTDTPA